MIYKEISLGLGLLLLFTYGLLAQNITRAEYFIDDDPGFGNGVTVPITAGTDIAANFSINVSTLSDGFHSLHVRVQDSDGNWSLIQKEVFFDIAGGFYDDLPGGGNIVVLEYFIDDDPGFGNGTSIAVSAGKDVNATFNVDVSSLSDGFHSLHVRALDSQGEWSLIQKEVFFQGLEGYYDDLPGGGNIVALEYFIDDDPGFGNGTSIPITSGQDVSKTTTVSVLGIAPGDHVLYVRARDSQGEWSLIQFEPFTKDESFTCPDGLNLTLDNSAITTNTGFEIEGEIISESIIEPNVNVSFQAGKSVTLLPGFHAKAGSTFRAFIDLCTGGNATVQRPTLTVEVPTQQMFVSPNPTSGQAAVQFAIEEEQPIHVALMDLQGNLVKTILPTSNALTGSYQIEFDCSNLSSGIYIVQLRGQSILESRKLVVTLE